MRAFAFSGPRVSKASEAPASICEDNIRLRAHVANATDGLNVLPKEAWLDGIPIEATGRLVMGDFQKADFTPRNSLRTRPLRQPQRGFDHNGVGGLIDP